MGQRITWTLFALSVSLLTSAVCADELAGYNAALGGLPHDSCWTYSTTATNPAPVNNGQAVVLGPTTTSGYSSLGQSLAPFNFNDGASITASVKVISSTYFQNPSYKRTGYYLSLSDGSGRFASLGISADLVLLSTGDVNSTDLTFPFNSTGAFHTYRLAFVAGIATVSIDGTPVLTDTVGSDGGTSRIASFGDASILAESLTHTAWVSVEGESACASGDLNCDGLVDGADLGTLLAVWGTNNCACDLNHDGIVDGADLGMLLANWG